MTEDDEKTCLNSEDKLTRDSLNSETSFDTRQFECRSIL